MTKLNYTKSETICCLSLVLMILAAPPCVEGQTPPEFKSQMATLSASEKDLNYRSALETVTVRNRFDEPLTIKSLQFEIKDFKTDRQPRLIYQISTFLDCIVVRVTNVGWGKYTDGESFSLFDSDAKASGGQKRIADLFHLKKISVPLSEVDQENLLVFRVGVKHVPFTFVTGSAFDNGMMERPPVLPGLKKWSNVVHRVEKPVYHTRSSPSNYQFSGSTRFSGRIHRKSRVRSPGNKPASIEELAGYVGRKNQFIKLSSAEHLLNRGLGTGMNGAIGVPWQFAFGNRVIRYVSETRARQVMGVTVDLGDGTQESLTYDVDVTIHPRKDFAFALEFVTAKSANFAVTASCRYRFGDGPLQTRLVRRDAGVRKTRVPRVPAVDFSDTVKFLAAIRKTDPTIDDRGRQLLSAFNATDAEQRARQAVDYHESSKLADAIVLAVNGRNDVSAKVAMQAMKNLLQVLPAADNREMRKYMPLLCRYHPEAITDYAVRCYLRERNSSDDLLTYCVCLDNVRPYVRGKRAALLSKLSSNEGKWTTEDFVLAAAIRHPNCKQQLVSIFKEGLYGSSKPSNIWAATQINDPQVNAAIRQHLRTSELSSQEATRIIRSLKVCGNRAFSSDVADFIERVYTKPRFTSSIAASLDYLADFPTSEAKSTLRRLRDYPSDSQIRTAARKLLGEVD